LTQKIERKKKKMKRGKTKNYSLDVHRPAKQLARNAQAAVHTSPIHNERDANETLIECRDSQYGTEKNEITTNQRYFGLWRRDFNFLSRKRVHQNKRMHKKT
jgi:hypothetical protein